jgi:hypothetical protein
MARVQALVSRCGAWICPEDGADSCAAFIFDLQTPGLVMKGDRLIWLYEVGHLGLYSLTKGLKYKLWGSKSSLVHLFPGMQCQLSVYPLYLPLGLVLETQLTS